MSKFKIISYIRWPDSTYNAPGGFLLKENDFTRTVSYFKLFTEKYAKMHDYAFEFREINDSHLADIKEALADKDWVQLDGSLQKNHAIDAIVLYKIKYTREVLERNEDDYVVFFDADAVPSKPSVKLEDFIDNEHELFVTPGNKCSDYIHATRTLLPTLVNIYNNSDAVRDLFVTNPNEFCKKLNAMSKYDLPAGLQRLTRFLTGFNEGFFIVKNTEKMKSLFRLMCSNWKLSLNRLYSSGADGHLFSYFLNSRCFYDSMKYMPFSSMGHHLGYGPYMYNEENTFLLHDSDIISMPDRVRGFQIVERNKWWKPLLDKPKTDTLLVILKYATMKTSKTFIDDIKDAIKKSGASRAYVTTDMYALKSRNEEFLKELEGKGLDVWTNEEIGQVVYI